MVYNPITESFKGSFESKGLVDGFPEYFHQEIARWLAGVVEDLEGNYYQSYYNNNNLFNLRNTTPIKRMLQMFDIFVNSPLFPAIENAIRHSIPCHHNDFFRNKDLCLEVLNFVVQKCRIGHAQTLENILFKGGHAYKVANIGTEQVGLVKRVSDELESASKKALSESELLREAWNCFYRKEPDFDGTVSKCIDALETKIKQKYYPDDLKPSFGKFLNQMKGDSRVNYAGAAVDSDKKLFEICLPFVNFRAQHTSGTGQKPSKEDAEFILHTSILLYNMI